MRKFVLAAILCGLFLVLGIGGIVLVEIALRVAGVGASRAQIVDVELFPYKNYTVSSQPRGVSLGHGRSVLDGYFGHNHCDAPDGSTAIFNSDGFRGPEFRDLPAKAPGEIRIVIVGGSASISWNIGEKCTLDANIVRHFESRFPGRKLRVINLGSGGWKSMQELIALQLHGLAVEPDIVVAFDGFNDLNHAFSMHYEMPYSGGLVAQAFERYRQWTYGGIGDFARSFRLPYLVRDFLASRAAGMVDAGRAASTLPEFAARAAPGELGTRPIFPVDAEKLKARTDFDPWNRQTVDFYLRNIASMARISSGVGADFVVALQPAIYLREPLTGGDKRVYDGYLAAANFTALGYLRARDGLAAIAAREARATFVDLSAPFDALPGDFFGDQVHFNIEGYKIVAERLFEALAPLIEARLR